MYTWGKFWYSKRQGDIESVGHRNFARLIDGSIVEYTEWKCDKGIDEPSNWDDAVFLGEGHYFDTRSK